MNAFLKIYFAILAFMLPATINAECIDNATFTFITKAGFEQDCNWIQEKVERAERYCVSTHPYYNFNVYKNCPLACSNVPSVTYTDTDGHEFPLIHSGDMRPCSWITYNSERKEKRMDKYCNFDKQMMYCPATCGCAANDDDAPTTSPSELRCTDLPETYKFKAVRGGEGPYTCGWLTQSNKEDANQRRKELYCTEEHQLYACAKTCGLCTKEPSSAPTTECRKDTTSFFFELENGKVKNCEWITKNDANFKKRFDKYCYRGHVKGACGSSCNFCNCEDNDEFRFSTNRGKQVGCTWLTEKDDKIDGRISKYCYENSNPQVATQIGNECVSSCGFCSESSDTPSDVPSDQPSLSPSDQPSDDTDPSTLSPTKAPTRGPTPRPTSRPTSSPSNCPVTCGLCGERPSSSPTISAVPSGE
ncbi:hypothetical protein CTEN210_06492 [Chaetoceros tenuissimus]|uniref:ShKT domain-containing protein n=1 Tax=Chaetoceros tenuissimus TaxID=426638 RepID=A0AAD3CRT3_9STRA|nr:hypothetical protein CTEN210_06492 [Chaetoceros tenuissimus]